NAEFSGGAASVHLDGGDRDVGARIDVLLEHLLVVHFVDVIAGKDEYVIRLLAADRINVLIHRIGGALIPVLRDAHLRGQNLDEIAHAHQRGPAPANMTIEAQSLVLGQYEYAAQVAIEAVRQGEIDDPKDSAERNRRLGAVTSKRPKPLPLAAGDQTVNRIAH